MKMSITNKESLRDYIHGIHDYLRNNGAGYGMTALKMFNVFYGLMVIENNEKLFQKLFQPNEIEIDKGLTIEDFRFSKLVEMANKIEKETPDLINDNKLVEIIDTVILDKLSNKDTRVLRDFIFYEIPKDLQPYVYAELIIRINSIKDIEAKDNLQLSGKVYEYFVGRDSSAISELGAYFTDRYIVNYIYDLVKPTLNDDKSVKSMIDPFGGSGGFTIGYTDYLIKNNQKINWKTEIDKIYHYDINEDVIKSAGLEIMALTSCIPKFGQNFNKKNSFQIGFDTKFDYIITNPPYGGDKSKKSANILKNEKIIEYIKKLDMSSFSEGNKQKLQEQLKDLISTNKKEEERVKSGNVSLNNCSNGIKEFCKEYNLDPNNKEGCSFILLMDSLKENGTCIGVLKEGVFFDGKYRDIRKVLVENYNVSKIISVPANAFENTTTKTSIIIFSNTIEKTSKIEFFDLIVNKEEKDIYEFTADGYINLSKMKDDIKSVEDKYISTANIDDIILNEYVLDSKKYNQVKLECNEDFEMIKFTTLCEYDKKSKRPASFGKDEGEFNFYSSSDNIKRCDIADYNETSILIGGGGSSCLHIDKNFSCSSDMHIIKTNININYFYFVFTGLFYTVKNKMHGSTIKHLTKDMLSEIELPIPTNTAQIEFWSSKIGTPYDAFISAKKEIEIIENNIQTEIQRICDEEECENVSIGDLYDLNYGKRIVKKNTIPGKYDVYGGGGKTFTTSTYNRESFNILISRFGMSKNCVRLMNENFYLNDNGLTIDLKNKNINLHKYIGYYLFKKQEIIIKLSNQSIQKALDIDLFKKFIIKLPKDESLIKNLEPLFNRLEDLHTIVSNSEKEYKQFIKELCHSAIKDYKEPEEEVIEEITEDTTTEITDNIPEQNDDTLSVSSVKSKSSTKSNKLKEDKIYCSAILKSSGLQCSYEAKFGEFCGRHKK
jgi:type I restriction-modification system DNA methylase subunit